MARRSIYRSLAVTVSVVALLSSSSAVAATDEETGVFASLWQVLSELWGSSSDEVPAQTETPATTESQSKSSPVLFVQPIEIGFAKSMIDVIEGTGRLEVPLELSAVPEREIEISYRVDRGTASSPEDFVDSGNGVLVIRPGEAKPSILQSIPDDTDYEGDIPENYYLEITSVKGGSFGSRNRVEIRIEENDPKPAPRQKVGRLTAVPSTIDFGRIDAGSAYDVDVTVRQSGDTDIRIGAVEETADRVRIISGNCNNVELSIGASCTIRLRFEPDSDGIFEGTLLVQGKTEANGDERIADLRIPLHGEGHLKLPDPDPYRQLRANMQLNRRLSKGVVVSSVVQPVKPSPREYITQQDYDPQAAPGNAHVTLPIDLERMITSFQSIPCVLENSINSQHPGQAVCIVEQNVYSYHGFRHRYVLIPGGSKFQGSYTPLAKQGDTRLSILWQRLLKPDGSMLMLPDGLPTQDAMGRTSLPGEIDNRMWEQFGTPILLTALTALASELVPQGTEGLSGAEQILVEGESRIVTQMLSNNLDLKPIMTIPTGSRLTVKPTIDLIFEPTRIRVLGSSSGVKQASLAENEGSNSQSVDDQGSSSGPPSLAAQPTTH
ncbi:TrbI/VirB10 family protein [Thalassospira xiamenensis]|jgi:type IV secretion system protein VirB10|uniref:TrbI/VirB10 family protein n=1 Tax=Thalassospira xiamenensis TaxID=220697 RepID=UPI000DED7371|nr:TrbI/VirB10 family protein [Thalassospira xiamenensis]RCK37300.1 hypothetical protein TH24_17175 [Thalassospira xiamenensis]